MRLRDYNFRVRLRRLLQSRFFNIKAHRQEHFSMTGLLTFALVLSVLAADPAGAQQPAVSTGASQGGTLNATPPGPVMFVPPGVASNAPTRPGPFSAEISADFMKKVMETSAKFEKAKGQIVEREAQLYATNPDIKTAHDLMVKLQKEINRILDADAELTELKMKRDILWSTMPALPNQRNQGMMPQMPFNR